MNKDGKMDIYNSVAPGIPTRKMQEAFRRSDVNGVVEAFNAFLAGLELSGYFNKFDPDDATGFFDETSFRNTLVILLYAAGLDSADKGPWNPLRSGLVIPFQGRQWVLGLELTDDGRMDPARAEADLGGLVAESRADGLGHPILLAMAASQADKRVNGWAYRIGLNGDDVLCGLVRAKPPKPAKPGKSSE